MRNRVGLLLAVAGLLCGVLGLSPGAAEASDQSVHTFLTGTVAFSPSDAWTVGWGGVDSQTAESESLHWNGTKWVNVKTASEGTAINGLEGISATGPADMWGVGWVFGNCLIEHYNGSKWANVPFGRRLLQQHRRVPGRVVRRRGRLACPGPQRASPDRAGKRPDLEDHPLLRLAILNVP